MVVCCAGVGYEGPLLQCSHSEVDQLCLVNILHPVYLTRVALDFLRKRNQKSLILTVSSLMAFMPIGGFSGYCSSKALIDSFSSALATELSFDAQATSKVQVLCYSPSMVSTKLNGAAYTPFLVPSPD